MNLDPVKTPKEAASPERLTFRGILRQLPGRLWKTLSHNLLWKLLAVFLAICLWAGLITQDPSLTRERVFSDVQVTISGSETLRRNGFVLLTDAEEALANVRLRVDVPQREYNTVSVSNYNPRIDLSKITQTGKQTLRISTSSSTSYGTVREISPDSIEVVVDEYITNYRIPVSVERKGQFPKGFYGTAPSLDPSSVTLSGPKTIVDQITGVVVDFDVSKLTAQAGLTRTSLPMRFVDAQGSPVESNLVDVTTSGVFLRSIIVEQALYTTKTLPLSSLSLTTGQPASGYEVKSIIATPNIIVAAGDDIGLSALDALFLEKAVDVTGVSESFTIDVNVKQPSELVYLSAKSVTLSIEIGPIVGAREFGNLAIAFIDRTETRAITSDLQTVSVTLTGPETLLNALKDSDLTVSVDVTALDAGEHELPLVLTIEGQSAQSFTYDISPKLVRLRIDTK